MNTVNVYCTPDGRLIRVPDEVWRGTKWNKDGFPDKRYASNALGAAWIDAQDAATHMEDGVDAVLEGV